MRSQPSREQLRQLALDHGLKRAGAREPLLAYTRELWGRRHFIVEFSRAQNASGYTRSMLGQAWQLLTPLLNAAVYYFIFGLLLDTKHGVNNFVAFLVIGVFIFRFPQLSAQNGSNAIASNLGLTRTLHFPRAVLPISATVVALQQVFMSLVVLLPIVLLTGEPIRWQWIYLVPAIGLEAVFCAGLAMIMARIGAKLPDLSQVLPFVLRVWMYVSGVVYSIDSVSKRLHSEVLRHVLKINPGFVYLDLVRHGLMTHQPLTPHMWWWAIGWALVIGVGGYIYFWRGEEEYGRV